MLAMIAALSEDPDLVEAIRKAPDTSLFWEVDGQYVEQRVELTERPAG